METNLIESIGVFFLLIILFITLFTILALSA